MYPLANLAVVILNYNGKNYLEKFLPSVCEYSPEATIVVADNASTDDSVAFLAAQYPHIRCLVLPRNEGFSRGYNLALAQIKADYYVLLNSDVEVTAGWLTPMLALFARCSRLAACQPKIKSYFQKTHFEYAGAGGGFIDYLGYPFCRGRIFSELEADEGQYNDEGQIFWASGACLMVKASAYHEIGGLAEDFFAHMEEIDFCWRLQRAGYLVAYTGYSEVFHVGGGTLSRSNPRKTYLNFRNNLAMLSRNLPFFPLLKTLVLRLGLDMLAALYFSVLGKGQDGRAVLKAYGAFYKRFWFWRKQSQPALGYLPGGYAWPRSLVFQHFLKKKKKFRELPQPPVFEDLPAPALKL
ncbi:MAG: glycosyltransferase family 2 protein [Microscillaceae bacterium]